MDLMSRRRALMSKIVTQPDNVLYNWNLKSSLVDTVSSLQATTNGTITANGLSFAGAGHYIEFPGIFEEDRTYVVRVGQISTPANVYARLLMVDTDPNTSSGGSGFVIGGRTGRNGDGFYIFPRWDSASLISNQFDPDGSYFDGTAFALYFDSNKVAHAYRNGVLIGNSERGFNYSNGANIYIGSNTTDDNFGDGLISGLTVYSGNIYQ